RDGGRSIPRPEVARPPASAPPDRRRAARPRASRRMDCRSWRRHPLSVGGCFLFFLVRVAWRLAQGHLSGELAQDAPDAAFVQAGACGDLLERVALSSQAEQFVVSRGTAREQAFPRLSSLGDFAGPGRLFGQFTELPLTWLLFAFERGAVATVAADEPAA